MVDRDITGEIRRVGLNRLPALLGIDSESLKELAERVRQFDKSQSDDTRQRKALEKLAVLFGQSTLIESDSEKSARLASVAREKALRLREIEALELAAVAAAHPHDELRQTARYSDLIARLGVTPGETREQGETRD
jgi:hypothetical protein